MNTKHRRLPRHVREQQMIDAAVAAFSRGDYHSVRVEEIAEAAGSSKPTVYHYLGSKEGVFVACVRRETDRLVDAIRGAVRDPAAPAGEDPLLRGMRAFFVFVTANRDSWTVLYRRASSQTGPLAREADRSRERVLAEVADLVAEYTRADGGAGCRLEDKDARLLARIAVSTADAYADWLLEHPEESPESIAGIVTELTRSHLRSRKTVAAG
ncbi:TetR/AcrR family transcriptional regulator [Nocardiopsis sp. LOL_012]|uniref:TetR/AcrR family transcriptional regulator n=1 Tax=Nocardiopsis sp. LOL_012 TaxID=3345409 RepID=UPI003A85CB36